MENSHRIMDALNEALTLEYSMIIHYPLINKAIKDLDVQDMVKVLGVDSIKHADVVADTVRSMGGKPSWNLDPAPDDIDLSKIFVSQLGKEKRAYLLHNDAARLVPDNTLRTSFENIALQELEHIKIVEYILAALNNGGH